MQHINGENVPAPGGGVPSNYNNISINKNTLNNNSNSNMGSNHHDAGQRVVQTINSEGAGSRMHSSHGHRLTESDLSNSMKQSGADSLTAEDDGRGGGPVYGVSPHTPAPREAEGTGTVMLATTPPALLACIKQFNQQPKEPLPPPSPKSGVQNLFSTISSNVPLHMQSVTPESVIHAAKEREREKEKVLADQSVKEGIARTVTMPMVPSTPPSGKPATPIATQPQPQPQSQGAQVPRNQNAATVPQQGVFSGSPRAMTPPPRSGPYVSFALGSPRATTTPPTMPTPPATNTLYGQPPPPPWMTNFSSRSLPRHATPPPSRTTPLRTPPAVRFGAAPPPGAATATAPWNSPRAMTPPTTLGNTPPGYGRSLSPGNAAVIIHPSMILNNGSPQKPGQTAHLAMSPIITSPRRDMAGGPTM